MLHSLEVLIASQKIAARVQELGSQISKDYTDKQPVLIGILNGAFVFMADLMRQIDIPHASDFLRVKSYRSDRSTGVIQLDADITVSIKGRDVILIEDILDTGTTLDFLINHLLKKEPLSLKVCCFLDKGRNLSVREKVSYTGFKIPDQFVVGYGLDYNDQYRFLPYVAVLLTER